MTRPRIVIAPHARELDTVLGRLRASIVYDQYFAKLVAAGAQPLVTWAGSPDVEDLVAHAAGVLLIGGGDVAPERFGLAAEGSAVDERRDAFETELVHAAKARGTPVLGVCRGAQVLNVALGGTLREVDAHVHGTVSHMRRIDWPSPFRSSVDDRNTVPRSSITQASGLFPVATSPSSRKVAT